MDVDLTVERNRYFQGKFMTARDFEADPGYLLERHRLHQRLFHGWGVVCGLRVRHHPDPRCARWAVVRSGITVDCLGRELILPRDTPVEVPESDEPLLLCLRYEERQVERVPVLYDDGTCGPARKEANRIREAAEVVFLPLREAGHCCWRQRAAAGECADCDRHDEDACLRPDCPCGEVVPLARLDNDEDGGYAIDMSGRTTLPPVGRHLTRIASVNWVHGGELTLDDLAERGGRLEVCFDRRLRAADGDADGINEFTFQVTWGTPLEGEYDVMRYDPDHPPCLEDGRRAVFTLDPDYLGGRRNRYTIAGSAVLVTLHCDFVLDHHDVPVDGTHLGGLLPSGNGTPGGTFTSWFRVIGTHQEAGPRT